MGGRSGLRGGRGGGGLISPIARQVNAPNEGPKDWTIRPAAVRPFKSQSQVKTDRHSWPCARLRAMFNEITSQFTSTQGLRDH